jgi:hypothetical protein
MGLKSEIVEVRPESRPSRRETLAGYDATYEEIEFLGPLRGDCCRVELNAMTSRQLVDKVEAAFAANGVEKVIPAPAVLEQQARYRLQIKLTQQSLASKAKAIERRAATMALPEDLDAKIRALLRAEPELSWDQALVRIIG